MRSKNLRSLAPLIAVLLIAVGCATVPPDRAALSTLQSVKVSAEAALTVAGSLYSQGAISDAQKDQVVTIYKQVEASSKTAAAALRFATTQGQADLIVKDTTDLLLQLQRLVASFTPPKALLFPAHVPTWLAWSPA